MSIRGFERGQALAAASVQVALDPSQQAVLSLPDDVSAAIIGSPGTGKTTTMIELIADRIENQGWTPDELLVLSPTRTAATSLRDRLAIRLSVPTLGPLARTANSVAFQLVRDAATFADLPEPQLLTGAEQDQIIAELMRGGIEDQTAPVWSGAAWSGAAGPEAAWPEILGAEVRRLPGFRTELRDLMMRAVEYGLVPRDLARLGREHDRPEWIAAAGFAAEYEQVLSLFRDRYFDSVELVREATQIVTEATDGASLGMVGRLRLILVDDAQETTESTLALVRACARRGVHVFAFGDPDISTGSFRGAKPEVLGRLADSLGLPRVETLTLQTVHRHGEGIRSFVSSVTARIGTAGAGTQRRANSVAAPATVPIAPATVPAEHDGEPAEFPGSVAGLLATSSAEEIAIIARRLRERHVFDGVPWSEMAVVVRSGSLVPKLARGLANLEVPTRMSGIGTALRDEYAIKAMVLLLEVGLGRQPLTPSVATELLTGPFGSLDTVSLRRLTSALRQQELAGGGDRAGHELVAEAMAEPSNLATIDTRVARRAGRLAASLNAVRVEAADGATIEELLWGVWQRSGLEKQWYEQSLATGIVAEEANRNLDAVVALFATAKRFVERTPQFSPHNFLDEWVSADVPEDTLAPRATREAVMIGTPTATIGREYSVVVIAGLQENSWPNLRVRGSLLGANDLADVLSGRASAVEDTRLAVMHDELRMFAQAASRARNELIVTAVANDDTLPSPFFRLVPMETQETRALHPLSLRGLVGRLRRELVVSQSPEAAAALARLAQHGIPGADPAQWYGMVPPSTTAPRLDIAAGDIVSVSPSRMQAFEVCPLHWLIEQVGGGTSNLASNLGTVIHKVAEQATDSSPEALWRAIEARWGEFDFESRWQSEMHKATARDIAYRLSAYLSDFERAGGRLLKAELSFELPVGPALLRGTIDRVELLADGTAVIVDLKTGKNDPTSDAAVADHPQLGAYQLAFASGAIEGIDEGVRAGGAKLVILSKGTQKKPYYDPRQPPFTAEELETFRLRVEEDAEGMAGSVFIAQIGDHCLDPWSYGSCRIHVIRAVSA